MTHLIKNMQPHLPHPQLQIIVTVIAIVMAIITVIIILKIPPTIKIKGNLVIKIPQ